MNRTLIFPSVIIFMSVCACGFYALDGDLRRTIYWAAASVLTAAVTF